MNATGKREIVVEFERIELIRKRAKTHLMFCTECSRESDHVSLPEAARLFSISESDLLQFIEVNRCHNQIVTATNSFICVVSLLQTMNQRKNNLQPRLKGRAL